MNRRDLVAGLNERTYKQWIRSVRSLLQHMAPESQSAGDAFHSYCQACETARSEDTRKHGRYEPLNSAWRELDDE